MNQAQDQAQAQGTVAGRVAGKVAFITGAARGQGRSHAVRLASEGADIIALDICHSIDANPYPLATSDDLAETVRLVERTGRRCLPFEADIRDRPALDRAVQAATAELGGIDIVIANAAISPQGHPEDADWVFRETIEINLVGQYQTVHAAVPSMIEKGHGGSIVLINSTAGLGGEGGNGRAGVDGYTAAKHGLVGLMRTWANWLGEYSIRVNSVHPSGVDTPMIRNDSMLSYIREKGARTGGRAANLLPVRLMKPSDISDAVLWLVSDEAKYVTGVTLPVDAGFRVK
ncbi:MAG TPA: mycofactocin-coupled SDR family oxidoreductase [Mycobacteriales bacterium]|nr:mycofactocin-coupled SDR family oxidoreductase [Mycobacteriales bacterium]